MGFDTVCLEHASQGLGPRDVAFLQRVLGVGLGRYRARLAAVGFEGLGAVLDVGCGFGQWSLALAETCRHVVGIDSDRNRVAVAKKLAEKRCNLEFAVGSMTELPFTDQHFDGVFCYSAIYYTDVRRSVAELSRVMRSGGRIYISSNGYGWCLFNILKQPNPTPDFSPRLYGFLTLWDTFLYRFLGRPPSCDGSIVTSRRYLSQLLEANGISVLAAGAEGSLRMIGDAPSPMPFFRGQYLGMECGSEWVGQKRSLP